MRKKLKGWWKKKGGTERKRESLLKKKTKENGEGLERMGCRHALPLTLTPASEKWGGEGREYYVKF